MQTVKTKPVYVDHDRKKNNLLALILLRQIGRQRFTLQGAISHCILYGDMAFFLCIAFAAFKNSVIVKFIPNPSKSTTVPD